MIRVTFDNGTTADLPEGTLAYPFGKPGEDETDGTLEGLRGEYRSAYVITGDGWRHVTVESWEEEARRLRAERDAEKARADAAEKKLEALRAWAEGRARWYEGLLLPATTWREIKETP